MQGGVVVGAGILLGNITGFFRIAIAAYLLGTHARADALAVSMGPLDTINSAILNTMLFAFVPMLMLRQGSQRAALFLRAGNIFVTLCAIVSITAAALASGVVSVLGPGLAPQQHEEAALLLRIMSPSTVVVGATGVYSALLYTERRFVVPALYQFWLNAGTIAAALLFWNSLGIDAFAVGYTAGAAVQLLLVWWTARSLQRVKPSTATAPIAEILRAPGLFLLYAALISANVIVTRAFATHAGSGMAAAVDYSMRCVTVVIAYLVYPVATSLVPEISGLHAEGETRRAWGLIDRGVGLMALAAAASCAAGVLLRTPVIGLLFERGSFTAESTRLVANVFLGFAPCLIGWALLDLIARCLFALDRQGLPVVAALLPVSVNSAITWILYERGMLANTALIGVGASAGLMAGFAFLFVAIHARRKGAEVSRIFRRSSAVDPARFL